jgi:hypothetical protein
MNPGSVHDREVSPGHAANGSLRKLETRKPDTSEAELERLMRIGPFVLLALTLAFYPTAEAKEDASLVESVKTGCQTEIGTYCDAITPGEGRVLSCLLSYDDKLSPRCEYALYDAAAQLERVVAALSYISSECDGDMKAHCAEIKPGEGRLLECLKKNDKQLDPRCKTALQQVGRK